MSTRSIFDYYYIAFSSICSFLLYSIKWCTKSKETNISYSNFQEKLTILIVNFTLFCLPYVLISTDWLDFASHNIFEDFIVFKIVGIILLKTSLVGYIFTHKQLGAQWSKTLEIKKKHQLIKTGIYKYIRHPIYLCLFGLALSQILLINNFIAGPSGLLGFLLIYFGRIPLEEQMMIENFGQQYEQYIVETGNIFPKF